MSTSTFQPATPRQMAFALKLLEERPNWDAHLNGNDYERAFDLATRSGKAISKAEASSLITALMAMPRPQATAAKTDKATEAKPVTEAGFYFDQANLTIYRVRPNKEKTRLYAEILTPATKEGGKARFNYTSGAIYRIDPTWLLTLEEARGLGRQFGFCVRCGALLEDDTSVKNGIGPVCIKKWMKEFGG